MRAPIAALIVSGWALGEPASADRDTATSQCETGTVNPLGPGSFPGTVLQLEGRRILALQGGS